MKTGLNADTICYFLDVSEKVFVSHSFLQMTVIHSRSRWTQVHFRDLEKHELMNQGKTQCWALFVISKATFTETAIKTKFLDRFF